MIEDLTCIFPKEILPLLRWLGKVGDWMKIEIDTRPNPYSVGGIDLPRTLYVPDYALLGAAPDCEEKRAALYIIRKLVGRGMVALGNLEAGGVSVVTGPKLFTPTFEQFESMENVDLHIPIGDFRSPYPSVVVRLPNEWRKKTAEEEGIDVQRQPLHVLVRTTKTVCGKVSILTVMHYPVEGTDHFTVITDQPPHTDLQSAIHFVADLVNKTKINDEWGEVQKLNLKEYQYCMRAVHAALNCCLTMVHFGHKLTGYVEPRIHTRNNKTQSPRRFADFQAVEMIQNVVIRQTSGVIGEVFTGATADHADGDREPLWEVKPHWRRGHWRRKVGWQAYVERGEQPPLSFVRPTLVRKDRVVGDLGQSQANYQIR